MFAEIKQAATDEVKQTQKKEISSEFQKNYNRAKAVCLPIELILNKKRFVSS
jgi:hypothetical protein